MRHARFSRSRKRLNSARYALRRRPRLDQHLGQLLQPAEQRGLLEGEVQFGRVEHVQQDDLVPAVAEVLQSGHHRVDVVEQVAKHHDHAAFFEALGQFVEDRAAGGLSLARENAP